MQRELQPIDLLRQGEFSWGRITPNGAELNETITDTEFAEVVKAAHIAYEISAISHAAMCFRLGDIYNRGVDKFGDAAYQHSIDGQEHVLPKHRIARLMWVASSIPAELRHMETLSFEHHEKVAKCSPEEIKMLLDKAESEKLTTAEIREEVKALHPPEKKIKEKKKRTTTAGDEIPEVTQDQAFDHALKLLVFFEQQDDKMTDGKVFFQEMNAKDRKRWCGTLKEIENIAIRCRRAEKRLTKDKEA